MTWLIDGHRSFHGIPEAVGLVLELENVDPVAEDDRLVPRTRNLLCIGRASIHGELFSRYGLSGPSIGSAA